MYPSFHKPSYKTKSQPVEGRAVEKQVEKHPPSYKTKSQPVEGRAVEKQVEKHPCYGCGMLGHKKVTCRFDKSKCFNLANTFYLGSTAHQLLVAELGPRNSILRDGEI